MSKFYQQGNVSDDSDQQQQKNNQKNDNDKKKFQFEDEYRSDQKNKMLTENQKKNSIFKKLNSTINTALNNRDYQKVWDNLQDFIKQIQKASKYIQKEGFPNIFLKTLKTVNEQINNIDAETKKKIKNLKGFNIMKQKLKTKIIPEYKQKLDNFKDEPQIVEESQSSKQPSDVSSESELQQEEQYRKFLKSDDPSVRRRYWLKRQKKIQESDKDDQKEEAIKEQIKQQKAKKKRQALIQQNQQQLAQQAAKEEKNKQKQRLIIASAKQAEQKIGKIWRQFGKLSKSQRREDCIQTIQKLNSILEQSLKYQDFEQVSLLLVDVPLRLLLVSKITRIDKQTNFTRQNWNSIFKNVQSIFYKLQNSQDVDIMGKIATFSLQNEETTLGTDDRAVYCQIVTFLTNLQRELQRSFYFLQNSQAQYSERLQDLIKFVEFMYKLSKQMNTKQKLEKQTAQISFRVLQNMYFMSNQFMDKINQSGSQLVFTQLSNQDILQEYVKQILMLNNQALSTKSLLYLIYNHAINKRDKAKDLLILTNLSETIVSKDYYTQVCFNRALVQLGISAFYHGNLYQTQQFLSTVCSMGKNRQQNKQSIRKFLGQNKSTDKDANKNRTLPYYLHLNIDFIQAVELIASMIIQIPFTLTQGGKITSKSFKKVAYQYQKSHFIAEPLNYRDLVNAASNDLKLGNMKECIQKLSQIEIWDQLGNRNEALENLKRNIKQTALKCYILANRDCVRCLSLQGLAKKFEMDLKTIKKLIYRQISQKKIIGSITSDGYLNLAQKRQEKQSGIRNINRILFTKIDEINKINQQIFKHKQQILGDEQQQLLEKEPKGTRKLYDAITQKVKNILNRRGV